MINYEDLLPYAKVRLCGLNGAKGKEIEPKLNLYIRLTDLCNSNCSFCEYHWNDTKNFDIQSMLLIADYLRKTKLLSKVQITGGEPTCNLDVVKIVKALREILPDTFIGMNSNGSNKELLREVMPYLDNIAISRHAIDDAENCQIFKNNSVMSTSELKAFAEEVGKDKVHLSCTLMKSHVGTKDKVAAYLAWVEKLGISDIGFVSLMPCNDFAKNEQVYFEDIGIEDIEGVEKIKEWSNKVSDIEVCCCANYEYKNHVNLYARFAKIAGKCVGQLVYDVDKLYAGFRKEEIERKRGI